MPDLQIFGHLINRRHSVVRKVCIYELPVFVIFVFFKKSRADAVRCSTPNVAAQCFGIYHRPGIVNRGVIQKADLSRFRVNFDNSNVAHVPHYWIKDSQMFALWMWRRRQGVIIHCRCFKAAFKLRSVWEGHSEKIAHQSQIGDRLLSIGALYAHCAITQFQIADVRFKKMAR